MEVETKMDPAVEEVPVPVPPELPSKSEDNDKDKDWVKDETGSSEGSEEDGDGEEEVLEEGVNGERRGGKECLDDPNFATICSFLANFGHLLRLEEIPFDELQTMLEDVTKVGEPLVKLHTILLRRVFKSVVADKWEKSLAKFGHTYCIQDGWEIERFGYKAAKLSTKIRLLKTLLEAQFDYNAKFKAEVNKLEAKVLRLMPLGQDLEGQVYWYQVDNGANLRVYREDVDDETWELVACDRQGLSELIGRLQDQHGGKISIESPDTAGIDEDSTSQDIKDVIRDTGKIEPEPEDEEMEESSNLESKSSSAEVKESSVATISEPVANVDIKSEQNLKMEVDQDHEVKLVLSDLNEVKPTEDASVKHKPTVEKKNDTLKQVNETISESCTALKLEKEEKITSASSSNENEITKLTDNPVSSNSINQETLPVVEKEDCPRPVQSTSELKQLIENEPPTEKCLSEEQAKSSEDVAPNQEAQTEDDNLTAEDPTNKPLEESHSKEKEDTQPKVDNDLPKTETLQLSPTKPTEERVPVVEPPVVVKKAWLCGYEDVESSEDESSFNESDTSKEKEKITSKDVEKLPEDISISETKKDVASEENQSTKSERNGEEIEGQTEAIVAAESGISDKTKAAENTLLGDAITSTGNQQQDSITESESIVEKSAPSEASEVTASEQESSKTALDVPIAQLPETEKSLSSESEKVPSESETKSCPLPSPPPLQKRKNEVEETLPEVPSKVAKTDDILPSSIVGEAIEESVMIISGVGEGALCEGGNEEPQQQLDEATEAPKKRRGRKKRNELEILGVKEEDLIDGGILSTERPVRTSRRIAQIRMKEEEQRRREEEEHLIQLKAAAEKKKVQKPQAPDYLPSHSSQSDSEEANSEEEGKKGKKGRKKKGGKLSNGKAKGGRPWATDSEDDDLDEAVEDEEEEHHEEYDEPLVFGSDHEFSPESDLEDEDGLVPSRHARTKKGEVLEDESGCKRCGKGDHPEWILLCDKCDAGWHASCLKPQLWVIPEGEWFCPPCQHTMLVTKLTLNLVEYDKLLEIKKAETEEKKRLQALLPPPSPTIPAEEEDDEYDERDRRGSPGRRRREKREKNRSRRRRIFLSDEEDLSDHFVVSDESNSDVEKERRSSEDSEDEPMYRLRARRAAKTFDYKEYDDLIKNACQASDEEEQEPGDAITEEAMPEEINNCNGAEGESEADAAVPESEAADADAEPELDTVAPEGEQKQGEETEEEDIDEEERNRRKELQQASASKRKKRSIRDLDDFSEGEDSDEDFHGSDADEDEDEVDEEALEEDEEEEWSAPDESDDSIPRRKGKHRSDEKYLDVGIRRSRRARKRSKVTYDESDQEEDEEEETKWNSEESDAEDIETPSDSDDETYRNKPKKKKPPPKSSAAFRALVGMSGGSSNSKKPDGKKKKKKQKRKEEGEVDRAWNASHGKKKGSEERVERRTRGRQINFKDILDSGESDDDGNILPKRRRLSSGEEDEDEAEASRRLAEKIKAANQREAALYAAQQREARQRSGEFSSEGDPKSEPGQISESEQPPESSKPAEAELQPVPAPPLPPALVKAISKSKKDDDKKPVKEAKTTTPTPPPKVETLPLPPPVSVSKVPEVVPASIIAMSTPTPLYSTGVPHSLPVSQPIPPQPPVTVTSHISLQQSRPILPPVTSGVGMVGMPPTDHMGRGIPLDISRLPNPALFPPSHPLSRPLHPMWHKPGPDQPYPFMGPDGKPLGPQFIQNPHPSTMRPGYPSPLKLPNPPGMGGYPLFREANPNHPGNMFRGGAPVTIPGLLPPGFPQGSPERFYSPPFTPYAMPPTTSTHHLQPQAPQGLYSAPSLDFRESLKEEGRGPIPIPAHPGRKEDAPRPSESEFGGLVSYFSSQRSEEDMDT